MAALVQKFIVEDASAASSILPQHVALVNPDGTAFGAGAPTLAADAVETANIKDGAVTAAKIAAGVIPSVPGAATTAKAGLVKQAAAVADIAADADAAALAAKVNTLLAALRAAGVVKA